MISYRLVSQNRNYYVTAKIIGQDLHFTKKAIDIANNPELISKFSPEEAMVIGFIASEFYCKLESSYDSTV